MAMAAMSAAECQEGKIGDQNVMISLFRRHLGEFCGHSMVGGELPPPWRCGAMATWALSNGASAFLNNEMMITETQQSRKGDDRRDLTIF